MDKLFKIVFLLHPLFFGILFSLFLISTIGIIQNIINNNGQINKNIYSRSTYSFALIFSGQLIAVLISQLIRLDIYLPNWDSPLRLILCIPIFIYINYLQNSFLEKKTIFLYFTTILPLSNIFNFFTILM